MMHRRDGRCGLGRRHTAGSWSPPSASPNIPRRPRHDSSGPAPAPTPRIGRGWGAVHRCAPPPRLLARSASSGPAPASATPPRPAPPRLALPGSGGRSPCLGSRAPTPPARSRQLPPPNPLYLPRLLRRHQTAASRGEGRGGGRGWGGMPCRHHDGSPFLSGWWMATWDEGENEGARGGWRVAPSQTPSLEFRLWRTMG